MIRRDFIEISDLLSQPLAVHIELFLTGVDGGEVC